MHIPKRELVMLHLFICRSEAELPVMSERVSQKGISVSIGLDRAHVSRELAKLKKEGIIIEKKGRVSGVVKRVNVYFLTDMGLREAEKLRKFYLEKKVELDGTNGAVAELARNGWNLVSVLKRSRDSSCEQKTVRMLAGMPKPARFVGRNNELARLKACLDPKNDNPTRLIALTGMMGIGKTTLVQKLVAELGERNILYRQLKEYDTQRTILKSISELLDKLGKKRLRLYLSSICIPGGNDGKVDLNEACAILAQDLKGLSAVIIFDDLHKFHDDAFVSTLKDAMPDDARLLLISRELPETHNRKEVLVQKNVVELELQGLNEEESCALLTELGVKKDAAALARSTKGHPLFIELAALGGRWQADADRYFCEELECKLRAQERKMLALLSQMRVPAEKNIASYAGLDSPRLSSLLRKALVREQSDGRLFVHEILKSIITRRLLPHEVTELNVAISDYYLALLQDAPRDHELSIEAAHHLISAGRIMDAASIVIECGKGLIGLGRGLELLSLLERIEAFHEDITIAKKCELMMLKGDILLLSGEVARAEKVFQTALTQGFKDVESRCLSKLAEIKETLSDWPAAITLFGEALEASEAQQELSGMALAHRGLGRAYFRMGNYDSALAHYRASIAITEKIGDISLMAKTYVDVGNLCSYQGKYDDAERHFIKALKAFEAISDKNELSRVCNNLGVNCTRIGTNRADTARGYFERCIATAEETGNLRVAAYGTFNAAEVCIAKKDYASAWKMCESALSIFRLLREQYMIAAVMIDFGVIAKFKKEWKMSEEYFMKGIELSEGHKEPDMLAQVHYEFGLMLRDKGDSRSAKSHFERARSIYSDMGNAERKNAVEKEMASLNK